MLTTSDGIQLDLVLVEFFAGLRGFFNLRSRSVLECLESDKFAINR